MEAQDNMFNNLTTEQLDELILKTKNEIEQLSDNITEKYNYLSELIEKKEES